MRPVAARRSLAGLARLALCAALLGLAACGSGGTWSGALVGARGAAQAPGAAPEARVRVAELELVVGQDPSTAAALAEGILREGLEGANAARAVAVRAFLVLCRASDALGAFERPLAFLPLALEAVANPEDGRRVAAEADRAWARLDGQSAASPEIVAALEHATGRADPAWEPMVAEALVQLATAERLAGPARGVAALRRAGFVLDWRLSSPWGVAPELDFDRPLGPETRALEAEENTGAGWDLTPLPTEQATFSDGEVTFFDLPQAGGTGFAEATLGGASDEARSVVLRLETNRRAMVFVDGLEVLARRDGDAPWLVQRDLALAAGGHRVTVKLASDDGKGFFRLRATVLPTEAEAGQLGQAGQQGLSDGALPPVLSAGDGAAAVKLLSWITERLERPASDVSGARHALQALERALDGAEPAGAEPARPVLALLGARIARASKQLSASAQRQAARTYWDVVLKAWPGNPLALRGLAHVAREEERPDEARVRLQGASDARTLLDALDDARRHSWEAESLGLAEQLAPIAPASPRMSQELIDTYRTFGRAGRAHALAARADSAFPGTATTRIAELMIDAGDPLGAADRLLALFQIQPERHPLLRSAVAALRAAGALDRAAKEVDAFLVRRPGDGWALAERVRIALQRGKTAEAQAAIDQALARHPDFAPLASLASLIAGRPESLDVLDDSAARITAFRLLRESEAGRRYVPFPIVELLERQAINVRSDGTTIELAHRIRMVQSKAGADALGDVRPPAGARILRARTLKADGRVLYPERTEGKAELSFPDLQSGDVVETAWVTTSRTRQDEGGYLTGIPFAAWSTPTLALDIQIALPPGLALVAAPLGGAPAPSLAVRPDGGTTYRFEATDLPAVPREPQAPGARAFFPFVDLRVARRDDASDIAAWHAIARLYAARFSRLSGADSAPATRELAATLGPVGTDRARRAAFEWVKRELGDDEVMNVFETPVANAILAKRGSRALVLAGLLRALGDGGAHIVLCAPQRDGAPPDAAHPSPNANRFFYPLVRVGPAWLDPARPYTPYGALPAELRGAQCLDPRAAQIGSDAPTAPLFVTVPTVPNAPTEGVEPPTFQTQLTVKLAADGTASAQLAAMAGGAGGTALRQIWLAQDDARRQILWTQWVGSLFVGARVTAANVIDADVAERPMRVTLALDLGTWAAREGDALAITKLIKPMPTADFSAATELAELVALPTRLTPLRVPAHDETLTLVLHLPAGYRPEALPPAIDQVFGQSHGPTDGAGADPCRLQQTAELHGQTLIVTRRIHLVPGRVDPAAYATFREFVGPAAQAFEAPLRLIPSR